MKLLVLTGIAALTFTLNSCVYPSPENLTNGNISNTIGNYPTARLHPTKKNYVVMPWRPYNAVDVTGFQPGQLGRDPYTATVDPKTGKKDKNTGKIFRIPARPVAAVPANSQN